MKNHEIFIGFTINNRPLYLQVSRIDSEVLTIITIDEPNEQEWINYDSRRRS
ncbi:conserved hypothetical protein [Gloeothece citriformis PCC 7424]|uniref:Uncharacterized protein n=1 Tax=Gloeothece citriformis (strain PCC 7424) TaxID=65393 RepID=B7KCR8_GLOC7|nr:conserved hypothetical protein [Gloeothece citriformis PCC 7424]